jgi:hypothetical protein
MERKRIVCERCRQSSDIFRDFTTGLWELPMGPAKISRLSWEDLGKTWLESHSRECQQDLLPAAAFG